VAHAIERALSEAGVTSGEIEFVAGAGSGNRLGDASEGRALAAVFGDDGPAATSVTAALGHLGAGAGPVNAAVAALAIDRAVMPPTLNLTNVDPACGGVDWIAGQARPAPVRHAVALARGLEGQNVALALRAI
jgi:3-oxoacyl-[acyl-carrier-protein] synthase II